MSRFMNDAIVKASNILRKTVKDGKGLHNCKATDGRSMNYYGIISK